jgi:transitional endoplasmic reticulum ATPase
MPIKELTTDVRVRVAEAKQRDAGRGTARIDDKTMRALDLVVGGVIAIRGIRETAAVAWSADPDDQDRNVIRMDGLLRNNAGVS